MNEQRIEPHKVTKPIQLLAAWLVGLCILDGLFLGAAAAFKDFPLASGILILAAILNVPAFLYSLFLLQTKYRPEMQEDTYYATYLDKNTNKSVEVIKPSLRDHRFDEFREEFSLLRNQIAHLNTPQPLSVGNEADVSSKADWNECRIGVNIHHPNYWGIRKALKAASIPVTLTFGSDIEPPSKFVLAINVDAAPELMQKALKELFKFPFDGVKLTTFDYENDTKEHIYVGSYALSDGFAPITDELRDLVQNDIDPLDLGIYVSKYMGSATKDSD